MSTPHDPSSRIVLDLRRRVLDASIPRETDLTVDLSETASREPNFEPSALPAWIGHSESRRKRPVFDRWQR